MADDLHAARRPALEELSGPLRRAVDRVRSESVSGEELGNAVARLASSGPLPGTFDLQGRLITGVPPPRPECAHPSPVIFPGGLNMSSANDVVQATCPGCKNTLRIPGNWIGQQMKCKHCSLVFQAKAPESSERKDKKKKKKKKRNILAQAARVTKLAFQKAVSRKRRKKKSGDVPQAKPYLPPPAIPISVSPNGPLPAALPATAVPAGAIQSAKPLPAAVPVGAANPLATLPFEPPRRRSRGRIQKIAFVALFCIVLGGLAAVIHWVASQEGVPLGHVMSGTTGDSSDGKATDPLIKTSGTRPPIPTTPVTNLKSSPGYTPIIKDSRDKRAIPIDPNAPPPAPPPPTSAVRPPFGTRPTNPINPINPIGTTNPPATFVPPISTVPSNFPRRLMAVIPANYPYATPISYGGASQRNLNSVVHQLAQLLRVPGEQIVILSDKAPLPKPPIKDVIETNVSGFLSGCRAQDRAILMLVGHGVEVNDKAYFMPLEGDKDNAETLIPMEWFYTQLEKSPARQKVLIVDVCRFDPARGAERGDVAKMGEKFDALLQKPPPGVQVVTACVAGEYSYEVPPTGTLDGQVEGGIMLTQVPDIQLKGGLRGIIQRPEDSIPIQALVNTLTARTKSFAKAFLKAEQTVRLTGTEAESKVVYDPKLPAPPRYEIKLTGIFEKGVASRADIESLFRDVNGIPPVKRNLQANTIDFDSLPPYPLDKLAAYKDEGADSPLREKVREAVTFLKSAEANQAFAEFFPVPPKFNPGNMQQVTALKNQLENIQKGTGLVIFKLDTLLEELDGMKDDRGKESKRWQANFDYVRARLATRVAYVYEYNAKLGEFRREIPEINQEIHRGWQLAAKTKLTDRDADKYGKRAKTYLDQLARDNAGTPWELFAKREKITSLGLEWQPAPK
jgi:hypothetical protein